MSLFAWAKLVMPLILEYIKEIAVPGAETKRTTPLERACIIIIIILGALLTFSGDALIKLHEETKMLKDKNSIDALNLAKSEIANESYLREIGGLRENIKQLETALRGAPRSSLPYDVPKPIPLPAIPKKPLDSNQRSKMIDNINRL